MTTLISNVTELTNWLNSPSGTGQLTANITINATTWTIPAGILTAGMILDGNGKIIFLQNTTGSNYGSWPGLLKLNGGTVQNFKFTGATNNNAAIMPSAGQSYLTNRYTDSAKIGTINGVWFDFCVANYVYFYQAADTTTIIGAVGSNYTVTNCQIGRNSNNPFIENGGNYSGILYGQVCSFNVSNSVFYTEHNGGTDSGAICGSQSDGSVSNCIFICNVKNYGLYCGVVIGGRNHGNISITNCYQIVNWYAFGYSYPMPILIGAENTSTYTIQNNYTIINLAGSGSFASGNPRLNNSASGTFNLTNVAYTRGFDYTAPGATVSTTNCINTYTSTTPNSTEPINSFGVSWNKSYTPPLLAFNLTSPWKTTNTVYTTPNDLDVGFTTPVITWVPNPSTLLYPSPLTTKQLNATADVAGTFVYTPPAGTILNIGAGQTLSTTFTPTDTSSYNVVTTTATVSVVNPPYKYIFTQEDLYDFLQNNVANGWQTGFLLNDISIDVSTWVVPSNAFTRTLDGRGKTITFAPGITNRTNWTGLFLMTGGTVKNMTITTTATTTQFALTSGAGHAFFLKASSTGSVDGVLATSFQVTGTTSYSAVMCGAGSNIAFSNCQVGISGAGFNFTSSINNCGAFCAATSGGSGFTGSFTNCIVYPNMGFQAATTFNGGFIAINSGTVTFNKCKVAGGALYQQSAGGFVGVCSAKLVFNNCYSLISQNASASNCSAFVGNVPSSQKIYFNNCYQIGTVSSNGSAFCNTTSGSGITIYNNYYNTASTSTRIFDTGSSTYVNNQLVVQKYKNVLSNTGFNGSVLKMIIYNSDMYVAGSFTSVNGNSGIQYLAKWNSTTSSWESVGGGAINGIVYSLAILGSTLYVGGAFTAPSSRITTWNGSSFTAISGDTFDAAVRVIYPESATSIFIGGEFILMNGVTTMRHIARWNGSSWSEPNNGINNDIYSIIGGGSVGTAYIGGSFTATGNASKTLNRISYYDGSVFQSIGSATDANVGVNSDVNTLLLSGTTLYLGGKFTTNNLVSPTTLNRWATQNTASLTNAISAIGSGSIGFNGDVFKIIINSGILYVMGSYTQAGGLDIEYISAYNSSPATGQSNWSSIAGYLDNSVSDIIIDGSTLYIGGDFTVVEDFDGNDEITSLGRFAQIPIGYNKTDYSATGQPSLTTPPIMSYDTYFTS